MSERLGLSVDGGAPLELPRSGVFTIGSARERVDLCLEGPGVGAVHCVIGRAKGGGFALKDLGTPGGTRVNGEPIQQRRLAAGDEIAIGARRVAVVDPAQRAPAPAIPEALPVPLPVLRGYRIEKRLGRGGMGSVYLAVQASLARRVALKVLDPALSADKAFVARFQAEARAAAALSHPHVVTVYDVFEEQGHHWLAMEYMERGNLEERVLRQGPLAPEQVLGILIEAGRGLEYAERRGIVHRDIKPANLMQDASGLTKIADLGLATETAADLGTASGTRLFGTPHFISPEQARGEPVDGRSDLYSLGATAYRLLTARTPFEGASTREILRARFTEDPRPLRAFAPAVPAALEAVVLRLLAREPAARFQSAAALLAELERLRGSELAASAPGSRRSWPVWLAAAAAVVAVLYAAGWLPGAPRADPAVAGAAHGTPAAAPSPADAGEGTAESTSSSDAPSATELDSDEGLKALERAAEAAYAEIPPNLAVDERRAALAELAAGYAGTTAARRFEEELRALKALAGVPAPPPARDPIAGIRVALAAAGDLERPLHAALEGFAAVPLEPAAAQDASAVAAREAAIRGLLAARLGRAEAELVDVQASAAAGRFDEVAARLAELVAWLEPKGPAELPPPGFAETELARLGALREAASQRAAGLASEREAHSRALEREEARALGALLSGEGRVARALARLDLPAAEAALGELAGQEPPGEPGGATADFTSDLRRDLAAGSAALDALVSAFGAGGWRRRAILDPRAAGRGSLSVVAADAGGLEAGEAGAGERIVWEAFAANPAALDQLFHQRLTREYTPEERRGIAFLMRLAAVERAVGGARGMLEGGQALAGEDGLAALVAGFDVARPWCVEAGDGPALDAELAAARLLVDSLAAAGQQSWALAATRAQWLLEDHAGTLLVRRLSDGSLLALNAVAPDSPTLPAEVPDAAPGGAPRESAGDGQRAGGG